ncbi:MAG: hypothetical protein ACFHWZ_00335 [Phycisphaerales bacterium]
MNRVQRWLYPELAVVADQRDLEFKVRELINRENLSPKREALKRSIPFALAFLLVYFAIWWTLPRLHFVPPVVPRIAPGVLALAGGWSIVLVNRSARRRAIRRAMVRCGIPICVPCGYDLSKTDPSDPCPECGSPYPELGDPATALRLDPKDSN